MDAFASVLQTEVLGAVVVVRAVGSFAKVNYFNDFNFFTDFHADFMNFLRGFVRVNVLNIMNIWHIWPDIRHIMASVFDVWDIRYLRHTQFIWLDVGFVGRVLVRHFRDIQDVVVQFAGFAVGVLVLLVVYPHIASKLRRCVKLKTTEVGDLKVTTTNQKNTKCKERFHRIFLRLVSLLPTYPDLG